MKKFFDTSKEVSIQSISGWEPAPEYVKNKLSKKYKKDVSLIALWMIGMVICLFYYLFLLVSSNQRKSTIIGLSIFLVGLVVICIWRIMEKEWSLRKIEEAEVKEVEIHHLTRGLHFFSAEAKITEDGETAISYIFYLNKKNLKRYRTDRNAKWNLVKTTPNNSKFELFPVENRSDEKDD